MARVRLNGTTAEWVSERFDLTGAEAAHSGLPLRGRLLREARLALHNAAHGRLQDVHPKRFRKLMDVAFGGTRSSETAIFRRLPRRGDPEHVDRTGRTHPLEAAFTSLARSLASRG